MEIFAAWPAGFFIAVGLIGLIVGSFLNVVAHRVPIMMDRAWREQCEELAEEQRQASAPSPEPPPPEPPPLPEPPPASSLAEAPASFPPEAPPLADTATEAVPPEVPAAPPPPARYDLWWPPSACPACGQPVAPQHNVPVLSWLWLRGRCAGCRTRISMRYPLVEAGTALLGLLVAYLLGPGWQAVAAIGFSWTLLAMSLIDIDRQLLPDSMTLPLLWAGLLVAALFPEASFTDLTSAVLGAAFGYASLWTVYQLFKLVTGKEGMGYGDFKLLAALGAWVGWQMLPAVILLSASVGTVVGGLTLLLAGRSRHTPIPFGPYLAVAGWVALLFGERIEAWYNTLLV